MAVKFVTEQKIDHWHSCIHCHHTWSHTNPDCLTVEDRKGNTWKLRIPSVCRRCLREGKPLPGATNAPPPTEPSKKRFVIKRRKR